MNGAIFVLYNFFEKCTKGDIMMKDLPSAAFICTGENALELSSAICCAGKLMKILKNSGYSIGGCYSCISPSKQSSLVAKKIKHMSAVSQLVITVGCEGFRPCDAIPDITNAIAEKDAQFFSHWLAAGDTSPQNNLSDKSQIPSSDYTFPSRATAVFCNGALVINLPDDVESARTRLCALLPSINFAIMGSESGKTQNFVYDDEFFAKFFAK